MWWSLPQTLIHTDKLFYHLSQLKQYFQLLCSSCLELYWWILDYACQGQVMFRKKWLFCDQMDRWCQAFGRVRMVSLYKHPGITPIDLLLTTQDYVVLDMYNETSWLEQCIKLWQRMTERILERRCQEWFQEAEVEKSCIYR